MRTAWLLPLAALAACTSTAQDPPEPTLASVCSEYYDAVGALNPAQATKLDAGSAQKVEAICNGSGSYGPKPNGNKMADVRSATAKVQALAKS
jgi:hypothetical protein